MPLQPWTSPAARRPQTLAQKEGGWGRPWLCEAQVCIALAVDGSACTESSNGCVGERAACLAVLPCWPPSRAHLTACRQQVALLACPASSPRAALPGRRHVTPCDPLAPPS